MVWKDKKEFTSDMKLIYNATNREMVAHELDRFAEKWNQKYLYAIQSWRNNWDELTYFSAFRSKLEKLFIPPI